MARDGQDDLFATMPAPKPLSPIKQRILQAAIEIEAEDPFSICQSTSLRKAFSSNAPSRNGVTRAGIEPANMDIAFSVSHRSGSGRPAPGSIASFSA